MSTTDIASDQQYKVAWVVPTWSGARLEETVRSIRQAESVEVVSTKERNWSLARAWNYAAEKYLLDLHYDILVLANDDILVRPDTGQNLAHGLLVAQFDPATPSIGAHPEGKLLLVTAYNLRDGHADVGCRWAVGAPDYSCFAIGCDYIDRIGPFDERFDPCYFEDNDSHRRLRMAGYEAAQWTPFFHYGSTTLSTDLERRTTIQQRGGTFEACRAYYIEKWGGEPGLETYPAPFGREQGT